MNRNREKTEQTRQVERVVHAAARATVRKKTEATAILTELFCGVLWALWGYFLGRCALPFASIPFGFALLCAATRRVPYVFLGLCLSSLSMTHAAVRVFAYTAVLLIRLLTRFTIDTPWKREEGKAAGERTVRELWPSLFSEYVGLRMASACVGVCIIGIYSLIRGGFLYYDLYGVLLSVVVAPIATLVFSGVFYEGRDTVKIRRFRLLGFLALAATVTYAARSIAVFGISVSAFGAMFLTLYMTRKYGMVKGILTGALCGLAYAPSLSPVFAFGALCGGLFFPVSISLSVMVTFVAGSAWALYVSGLGALSGLLPGLLAANVLYAVTDKLFLHENKEDAADEGEEKAVCRALAVSEADSCCLSDMSGRVKTLCESFSELSEVFSVMGRSMQRPGAEDLRRICDNAFDSSCGGCACREECWEARYRDTDAEIGRLCAALHTHGKVEFCHVGEELASRCTRLPDILDEINCNAALYESRMLQCDRTEIFAMDYAFMADVLAETMRREREAYAIDVALSETLAARIAAEGLDIAGVMVLGGRRRRVVIRSRSTLSEARCARLAGLLSEAGGMACGWGSSVKRDEGDFETVFAEKERLAVSFARRTVRADGEEEYCGDTVGVFRNADCQYAFISDGMGAGREAAVTSGICALFLQKLLQAGNRCETAFSMLNGFLRNKGGGSLHECSATVDLMELDLLSGRASFYKSGAAPTYVLRDGSLFKLRSKTLPIGILKETDVKRISFEIAAGDVIVMVSDGVTQGREECPWLFDLLRSNVETLGIEKTADLIVRYAKSEGANDDLSVLILRPQASEEKIA